MRPAAAGALATSALVAAAAGAWLAVHRSSRAVRTWRPGTGSSRDSRRRGLGARVWGEGEVVVVLLSGLAASQRYWGTAYDRLARGATVVAIDPLGFGSSMQLDDEQDPSDPTVHVRAVETTLAELGLAGRPTIAVGHSLGASLALRWAASTDAVREVVCFGAPLYRGEPEVADRMRHLGWLEAMLARGPLAERVCRWMCEHRDSAQWLAVAVSPDLPVRIARDSVLHTWPGYIGAFRALIEHPGWSEAVEELSRRGVPVHLVYGEEDGVPVDGRAEELASRLDAVTSRTIPGGHDAPLARAEECAAIVEARVAARVNAA